MEGYPKFNKDDAFTIDFNSGTFTPDFKSSLKNYFVGESKFTTCGQPKWYKKRDYNISLGLGQGRSFMANVIELDNVNRYFSETETSESKLAYLGLALDSEDSNLLHVLVVDHESRSFLKKVAEGFGGYNNLYNGGERPTANQSNVGFELTFTKAK